MALSRINKLYCNICTIKNQSRSKSLIDTLLKIKIAQLYWGINLMAVLYFYHRGRSDFLRQCLRNVRESCWDPKRKCCVTKSVLGFQQCMKNEWRKCRRRHATQRNVIEIKWVLLDSRDRSIITEMENQIARSNIKERKSVLLLFVQEKVHRNGYFKPKSNFIISRDQGNF